MEQNIQTFVDIINIIKNDAKIIIGVLAAFATIALISFA